MDTVLNLGLNDKTVLGLAKWTKNERFAWDCYRRFITIFGDVVLGIERHAFDEMLEHAKSGSGGQDRRRSPARAAQGTGGGVQAARAGADGQALSPGPGRAAEAGRRRRLRLVVRQEGGGLPPNPSSARRLGHRGHGDGHGLRQSRGDLGHGRLLHARPVDGRAALLRRVPRERAGRGRGGGHPDTAAHRRARRLDAEGLRGARRHQGAARAPLPRHAGHRVHRAGRAALHPADALGQAHRRRRRAHRGGDGAGAADRSGRRRFCAWSPPLSTSSWSRPSIRRRPIRPSRAGSRPRRPPPWARSCSIRRRPSRWRCARSRPSSSGRRPPRRTWPGCTRRRAC